MKKTLIGSVSFLLVLIIAGIIFWQNNVTRPDKQLLHADTLMLGRPDSALHVLQSINNPQSLHGENKALYALLMTQAQYKNHLPVKNDSLIRIAVDYYANGNDSLRKAWSYFYAARFYQATKDKKLSLEYYQKAGIAAKGSDNYKLLDLLYYYWGKLLQAEKPYEEGLDKLMKAKKYGEINKDTLSIINTLGEIAWSYLSNKKYNLAQNDLLHAIQLSLLTKQNNISWLYYRFSLLCWSTKEYPKALEYINASLFLEKDTNALKRSYFQKGSIFNQLHQYDSARYYIEKGKRENDFYKIADYHNEMFKLEKNQGNYERALTYHEIYSNYIDSIKKRENDERLMEFQKKYDYTLVQNENMQLKAKSQRQKMIVLIIAILLLIFTFLFYYIYNKIKSDREKIIRTKDTLLDQSIRQMQQKTNELIQYRETIREKEEKLRAYSQKEQGLKDDISSKNEKLQLYAQQQKELKEQIFKMNETVKKIESMNSLNRFQKKKNKTELALSKDEIQNLYSAINLCYNNFEKRLRIEHPKLTDDDIYVCCLIKMKKNNQDIAILLASSDDALKKRKYRIKHERMNITQEEISLDDYLDKY